MKWIIVIFIYATNPQYDRTIEGYVQHDTRLECEQERLRPELKEIADGYLRLKSVNTVNHKCVAVFPREVGA